MLRRFALKRRRRHRTVHHVWVKDLKGERAYLAAVPDVAAERGFYHPRDGGLYVDWLEERLARIENVAAPAIARLIESHNWQAHTDEDRVTLAIFLISLYSRGPRVRRNLAEMAGQILEHFKAIG